MQANSVIDLIGQRSISELHTIDSFSNMKAMPDAKKNHMVTMGTLHITDKKDKTDENRENRKLTYLKTDHRSVFGLFENRSGLGSVSVSRKALLGGCKKQKKL
jgi:hypothetical protein